MPVGEENKQEAEETGHEGLEADEQQEEAEEEDEEHEEVEEEGEEGTEMNDASSQQVPYDHKKSGGICPLSCLGTREYSCLDAWMGCGCINTLLFSA